jgi:hypothetical protein
MDMAAGFQEQFVFHLTGKRPEHDLAAVDGAGLRPALLAPYRDLNRLRHDFPLVLLREAAQGPRCARSRAWSTTRCATSPRAASRASDCAATAAARARNPRPGRADGRVT